LNEVAIILFILISMALFVLIFRGVKKNGKRNKSEVNTKQDIVDGYERLILDVIEKNRDNKELLLEKKTQLLKAISKDLHNNIYFDDDEAKYIVSKLAEL
jgi:membrane protein implicated in regulation of membrane protease activity